MKDLLSTLEALNALGEPEDLAAIGSKEKELPHLDKLRISQSFPQTEYGAYLGRHYLAAGYSSSDACGLLDMLSNQQEGVLPYIVIPLRGGNLPWLESTASYLDSTASQVLLSCLKVGPGLSVLNRYAGTLHQHARQLQHRLSVRQTHLAKELAEAYVRRPQLDEKVLSPVLELTEIYGQPSKPKRRSKLIASARFDEKKLYVPNVPVRVVYWLCNQGKWTVRGIRHEVERVLQQTKSIFDYGILQGQADPNLCIEAGLERTLVQLKSAEQCIRQVGESLNRIESIFSTLLPHLGNSTRIDKTWK